MTSGPVLVTGAAGFAGSHLIEHLTGRADLIGWSRFDPPLEVTTLAKWMRVDLLDRQRVREAIAALQPAAVYHCAGAPHVATSWQNTADVLASNVMTTHSLLDALRRTSSPCRVLITGSAMVYAASHSALREDDPLGPASPYALSKLAQEQLGLRALAEDGIDVLVARPFNHTGARQLPTFAAPGMAQQIARIERGLAPPIIEVGNLDAQRDLTDVRDVVRAYALLMGQGLPGTIYNVASGTARPMRAVLDALIAQARVPIAISIDAGRLRRQDTPVLLGDATRLREATGWSPAISFERMLTDLLEYWRNRVTVPPS